MSLKSFEQDVKFESNNMFSLSRKDVQEMQEKHLAKEKGDWHKKVAKADKILDKYGYGPVTWREWKKKVEAMERRGKIN